jgi:hypothetical protein
MVRDHQGDHASQWAAIASIASKIGCTAESLRRWLRQAEHDAGMRPGATTDERERIKALERENRELRQANEILRKASAYFALAYPVCCQYDESVIICRSGLPRLSNNASRFSAGFSR